MDSKKEHLQKVVQAKIMSEAGSKQEEIAQHFGVSRRTVRRWLTVELDPDLQQEVDELSLEHREKYIEDAWKIAHLANKRILAALEAGELSGKEAAVVGGISMDKIARLSVKAKEVREIPEINFIFHTTQGRQALDEGNNNQLPEGEIIDVDTLDND